jgi:hypothetical protein
MVAYIMRLALFIGFMAAGIEHGSGESTSLDPKWNRETPTGVIENRLEA